MFDTFWQMLAHLLHMGLLLLSLNPLGMHSAVTIGPSSVLIEFKDLPGVAEGAPVVVEGDLVGSIVAIESGERSILRAKIAPPHRGLIKKGTIALLTSPLPAYRSARETVIELLIPEDRTLPLITEGERLTGYASFEELWADASVDRFL